MKNMNDIITFRRSVSDQVLVDARIGTSNIGKLCLFKSEISVSMSNLSDIINPNIDVLIKYMRKSIINFHEQIDIKNESTLSRISSIKMTPNLHTDSDWKADDENETVKPKRSKKPRQSRWRRTNIFFVIGISYFQFYFKH